MMSNDFENLVQRLESVASRLENLPQLSKYTDNITSHSISNTENNVMADYEKLIKNQLEHFLHLSEKIGYDVQKAASLVKTLYLSQLDFVAQTVSRSKPSESDLQMILKPTSDAINAIVEFRECNRRSEYFNHLSAISEGIPALGWVTVSPAPCPFIKEMQDSSQFYTNRVIKDFKEKDASHSEWTKAWLSLLTELQVFVKKHFKTGVVWCNKEALPAGVQVGTVPPPCPPSPPAPVTSPSDSGDSMKRAALFADLNKGTNVTSGLKKVTDDMKTHKNPDLRAGNTVSAKEAVASHQKTTDHKEEPTNPPSMRLEGKKWLVEYFKDKQDIIISDTSIKQTLYIFKCTDSLIKVNGKINNIVLDSCKKTAVVFDGLISSLDMVNCQSIQAQTLGLLPIVNIDKTDGAQIVLNSESLGVEIVSAKSSEMNVIVPAVDGQDVREIAVPEQFKTRFVDGKLMTTCADDF